MYHTLGLHCETLLCKQKKLCPSLNSCAGESLSPKDQTLVSLFLVPHFISHRSAYWHFSVCTNNETEGSYLFNLSKESHLERILFALSIWRTKCEMEQLLVYSTESCQENWALNFFPFFMHTCKHKLFDLNCSNICTKLSNKNIHILVKSYT